MGHIDLVSVVFVGIVMVDTFLGRSSQYRSQVGSKDFGVKVLVDC